MRVLSFLILCAGLCCATSPVCVGEVRIEGNRVIVTNDAGETIDTANLPKGKNVTVNDDVEINEHGVSVGSVSNKNGKMKNVTRSTKLENVTIINDGKAKTYNKKE